MQEFCARCIKLVKRRERKAADTGFGLNNKKLPIIIKLKSVGTFSGVFELPIPHG